MKVIDGVFILSEATGISHPTNSDIDFMEDGNKIRISILTVKRLMSIIELEEDLIK